MAAGQPARGVAVDAATRGYSVLLLEQHDFGKGTSSRSTKLVHGGVRYLEQGNVSLVMEALKERGLLRQNAPHLVSELACIVPSYAWWEGPFYGIGLKLYELLAANTVLENPTPFPRRKHSCNFPMSIRKDSPGAWYITTASSTIRGCSST